MKMDFEIAFWIFFVFRILSKIDFNTQQSLLSESSSSYFLLYRTCIQYLIILNNLWRVKLWKYYWTVSFNYLPHFKMYYKPSKIHDSTWGFLQNNAYSLNLPWCDYLISCVLYNLIMCSLTVPLTYGIWLCKWKQSPRSFLFCSCLISFFSSFFVKFQYYKSSIYADLITQKSYIVNLSTILIILVIFILCDGKDSKVLGQIGFYKTFDA